MKQMKKWYISENVIFSFLLLQKKKKNYSVLIIVFTGILLVT